MNIQANNYEGRDFLLGMNSIWDRKVLSQNLFKDFIIKNGFSAWHIHDGWIRHKYRNGQDVLENNIIEVTWIPSQRGYNFGGKTPKVGEKMVIIEESPDINRTNVFDMYCYEVIEAIQDTFNESLISLIEVKKAKYNLEKQEYEFGAMKYKTSENMLSILKKWIKSIIINK